MDTHVESALDEFEAALKQDLSANIDWLRALSERQTFWLDGHHACPFVSPSFLARDVEERARATAGAFARAITTVVERATEDEAVRTRLAIPFRLMPALYIEPTPKPRPILGRADGMLDDAGVLRFLELNPYPAGLLQVEESYRLFDGMPAIKALRGKHEVRGTSIGEEVIAAFRRDIGADGGEVALGTIESPAEDGGLGADHEWSLESFVRNQGITTVRGLHTMAELLGGRLHIAGVPVTHVFVEDWSFIEERGFEHPIVQAIQSGAVRVLNGCAASAIAGSKTVFSVLSDPELASLFDPDVRAVLATHVPWTRTLAEGKTTYRGESIDLFPFVAENRASLVLKPAFGLGGRGVVLGWEVDEATWSASLAALLQEGGVVQERVMGSERTMLSIVEGRVERVVQAADYCPFVWSGARSAGAFVRTTARGMSNVRQGGALTPVFSVG